MIKFITLETDGGEYELTARKDEDESYSMPSLSRKENGKELFFWDNPTYLVYTLMPILKGEKGFKEILNQVVIL